MISSRSLEGVAIVILGSARAGSGRPPSACRTFRTLPYPAGEATVPAKKRAYLDMKADQPLADYLPPAPAAAGLCQVLPAPGGGVRGYAFRLGSAAFPHLKLQVIDYDN